MTNIEILESAIQRINFDFITELHLPDAISATDDIITVTCGYDFLTNQFGYFIRKGKLSSFISYQQIIFSRSFAEAFFGDEKICKDGTTYEQYLEHCAECGMTEEEARDDWEIDEECVTQPVWQYHLQKMSICEDPLRYLERFLK